MLDFAVEVNFYLCHRELNRELNNDNNNNENDNTISNIIIIIIFTITKHILEFISTISIVN